MMRLSPRMWRNLALLLILMSTSATVMGVIFMDRANDPFISYYGQVMRKSEFMPQRTQASYCHTLSSFSFAVNFVCFDSMEEAEAFGVAWRSQ